MTALRKAFSSPAAMLPASPKTMNAARHTQTTMMTWDMPASEIVDVIDSLYHSLAEARQQFMLPHSEGRLQFLGDALSRRPPAALQSHGCPFSEMSAVLAGACRA